MTTSGKAFRVPLGKAPGGRLVDLVLELDEEAALGLRSGRRPRGAFGTGAQVRTSPIVISRFASS